MFIKRYVLVTDNCLNILNVSEEIAETGTGGGGDAGAMNYIMVDDSRKKSKGTNMEQEVH